jgi:hypothetical protein
MTAVFLSQRDGFEHTSPLVPQLEAVRGSGSTQFQRPVGDRW